ncbi:MAG: hypothetical protein E7559_00150 [Ruminococcaceae bacterium]|nr:hypothetical protein [Oscillospiraceae bacterium]
MMTKKNGFIVRCIAAAISMLLLTAPLCGCGKAEPPVDALFIAGGITSGNTVIDEDILTPLLESAADNPGAAICASTVDGAPEVVYSTTIAKPDKKYAAKIAKQERSKLVRRINAGISGCVAAVPEVDMMNVLYLAEDFFGSFHEDKRKVLFIHHNGLSTTGLISFSTPYKADDVMLIIDVPAEEVVKNLADNDLLPDLADVQVIWSGFGKATDKQSPFSRNYAGKLECLWDSILSASGATVDFITEPKPNDSVSYSNTEIFGDLGLPRVTPVVIPPDELDSFHVDLSENDADCAVRFNPGEDTFIDESKAVKELQTIAGEMLRHGQCEYVIAGSTASFGDGDGKTLAHARAQRCADVLIKAGVPADSIVVIGLGKLSHSKRASDVDANGRFVEGEAAAKNRAVYIYPTDSDFGKEVLGVC